MKKMKFKILALFMMIILVGIGCSAVFAEEVEVLKVKDLYKPNDPKYISGYTFYGKNGTSKYIVNDYTWSEIFRQKVLDNVFEFKGEEYIRYDTWMLFFTNDAFMKKMDFYRNDSELASALGEDIKETFMEIYKYEFEYDGKKVDFKGVLKENAKNNYDDLGPVIKGFLEDNGLTISEIIESSGFSWWMPLIVNNLIQTSVGDHENPIMYLISRWNVPGNRQIIKDEIYNQYYADYFESKKLTINIQSEPVEQPKPGNNSSALDTFWGGAFNWFQYNGTSGNAIAQGFLADATNILKIIGNMIFIVVTAILGVKYIWGSADAKHDVKGSLFSLVLAAVVFYGWDIISNILKGVTDNVVSNSMQSSAIVIYSYILYFVNIAAIAGIIFLGVKYLMASAEGKSQLKMKMGPAFLGIIMVYATISFLNTILSIFLG